MKNVLKLGVVAGLAFFSTTVYAKSNNHTVSLRNTSNVILSLNKVYDDKIDNYLFPKFSIKKNKVKLTLNNLDGEVKISVFDLSDDVYYNSVQSPKNGKLNIDFYLNPEVSKAYIIRIERNDEVFQKTFYVD